MAEFTTRRSRFLVVAVGVSLVAGSLGAVALATNSFSGADGASQNAPPVAYSPIGGWAPAIPAGATSPAAIADAIAQAPDVPNSLHVSVVPSPDTPGAEVGDWLEFQIPTTADAAGGIRSAWQADIVQGIIAEAFSDRGLAPVVGSKITGTLPDGNTVDLGGGMGNIQPGQSYSTDTTTSITQRIAGLLPEWNLTLQSLDILRVGQPAPALVVTTNDPTASAAAARSIIQTLFWASGSPIYEGYFFQVDDAAGSPVLVQSAAFRTGAGRLWAAPSVASSSSLLHG